MLWSIVGLITSAALGALAFSRSRAPGGFYDAEIYGMTPAAHRRYGWASLACALGFALALALHTDTIVFWLLAAAVLIDVFYLTSYLRGASEDDV